MTNNVLHFTVDVLSHYDPLRAAETIEAMLGDVPGVRSQDWELNPEPIETTLEETTDAIRDKAREMARLLVETEGTLRQVKPEGVTKEDLDRVVALGFIRIAEATTLGMRGFGEFCLEVATVLGGNYETTEGDTPEAGQGVADGATTSEG